MIENPFILKEMQQVPRGLISQRYPMVRVSTPAGQIDYRNILPHIMLNPVLGEQNRVIAEEAVRPDAALLYATHLAQRDINKLRSSIGLSTLPSDEMRVAYVPQEKYNALFQKLYQLPEGAFVPSLAHSSEFADAVLVSLGNNNPSYYLGAAAYHELIHRNAQKFIGAYAVEPHRNMPGSEIYYEMKRVGLAACVSDWRKDAPRFTGEMRGELLNEVINFGLQAQYLTERLHGNEPALADEIAVRTNFFNAHPQLANPDQQSLGFRLQFSDGSTKNVGIHKDYFIVTNDGQFTQEPGSPRLMEFATNLSDITGAIEGVPFLTYLAKTGLDPRLQPKLREAMDAKFGKGFYSRLQRTPYDAESDEFLQLFVDVQKHLYIIP